MYLKKHSLFSNFSTLNSIENIKVSIGVTTEAVKSKNSMCKFYRHTEIIIIIIIKWFKTTAAIRARNNPNRCHNNNHQHNHHLILVHKKLQRVEIK